MTHMKYAIATLALLTIGAGTASAQRANADRVPPRAERGGQLSSADVVSMLDAWAVVQAQEALQLSDAQYGPFVTRLKKLQETRRRNQRMRNRLLQDLRQLAGTQVNPPYDDNGIRDRLRALREHDERAAAELKQAYDALDQSIEPAQQARFRIFEETLERRKLDLLMRARQGARRGAGGQESEGRR
ncbi:MAG TPA: hypothetical protein VF147_10035 [Vicinamibacterales bacterium]